MDNLRGEACDDAREFKRHMVGALLMGTGGIMSIGVAASPAQPAAHEPLTSVWASGRKQRDASRHPGAGDPMAGAASEAHLDSKRYGAISHSDT